MTDFDILCSLYDRKGVKYSVKTYDRGYGPGFSKAVVVTVDHECEMVDGFSWFEAAHVFDAENNLIRVVIHE